MTESLKRDDFAEHKGTKFKAFLNPEKPTEFELVDVSELQEKDNFQTFSLVFEAPLDAELVTGIVKMEHESLGSLSLGVSPFVQDEKCTKYEAVFNRSKPDQKQPQ